MPVLSHVSRETFHIGLDSSYPTEIFTMFSLRWIDQLDWIIVSFNNDLKEKLRHEQARNSPFTT